MDKRKKRLGASIVALLVSILAFSASDMNAAAVRTSCFDINWCASNCGAGGACETLYDCDGYTCDGWICTGSRVNITCGTV